jgi:hypothetical protein
LTAILDSIIIDLPDVEDGKKQHPCLEAGYVSEQAKQKVRERNYILRVFYKGHAGRQAVS